MLGRMRFAALTTLALVAGLLALVALGAVVLLGDEMTHSVLPYRQLAAVLRLPSGALFEVWTHLTDLHPSPEWAPTDQELIAA